MREERDMGARRKAGMAGPIAAKARRLSLGLLVALLALTALASPARAVVPELLVKVPEEGAGGPAAGRMDFPWGIAADPNLPADLYVADELNERIDEFTPWGEFVRAWGWGVKDGKSEFQICTTESDCVKGKPGGGPGQFKIPEGIAIDTDSNVYVIEAENHRVQKFNSEGNFILTFGLDVNKTKVEGGGTSAERSLCTAASGDVCQAGKAGGGPGQFGLGFPSYPNTISTHPTDKTFFVGEGERIQAFNPGGTFKEEIKGGCLAGKTIKTITSDAAGDLYVFFDKGTEVRKLKASGPVAECLEEPKFAVEQVRALAVDSEGKLYASVRATAQEPPRILEFSPDGVCLNCGGAGEAGKPGFDRSEDFLLPGLAIGSACGGPNVYVTQISQPPAEAFLRIYGAPPNPTLCPRPKVPPQLLSEYATSVDADSAELRAQINPRFWDDTTYYLEYGTSSCSEGGCASKPAPPGSQLTTKVTKANLKTAGIVLEGLEPGTTYHYRFVTESGGGGPVIGSDRTFTTFRRERPEQACPENEALRGGPSTNLPDCRAYEMVSPPDKDGGDIYALPNLSKNVPSTLDQSSLDGSRLSYGTYHSFGNAESAPFTTQFIAARGEEGWTSHGISPPHGRLLLVGGNLVDTELKVLSPDLCEAWLRPVAESPLAEGAVPGYVNLYRRTDEECGGPSWEALTTVEPPNVGPDYYYELELAGLSADRTATIYVSNDSLTGSGAPPAALGEKCVEVDSCNNSHRLYFRRAGEAVPHFVCVLPDGSAAGGCRAGTGIQGNLSRAGVFLYDNYQGAISADGSRVFWSIANNNGVGPLYVREHPDQPQSALAHGAASGTGTLIEGSEKVTALIAAEGKAEFTAGSATATLLETKVGRFVAGQPVTALGKVPAGTTIKSVSGQTLTLDKNATASGTQTISSRGPMPFEVGQEISGKGIPLGTTITEAKTGELKLSKAATASGTNVPLNAISDCTEAAKACTIAVSAEAEALSGASASRFWAAAADGSAAIFATPAGEGSSSGLYRFEVETKTTTKIAGKVPGVLGVSEDASHVYFATEEDCGGAGKAGQLNLYLYETGEQCGAGELAFVAALDKNDALTYAAAPISRSSRVSTDGQHLVFMSLAQPTGYDNREVESDEPAAEVYLYDAAANGGQGKLLCPSCNPSGARPQGHVIVNEWEGNRFHRGTLAALIPTFENNLYAPRVLSEDGNRLFFESFDALTLRDTNGLRDVYQWEAPGTGSCEEGAPNYSAQNEGCVDLISSGQSGRDSRFVDSSADGSDVFFTTLESFVGADFGLVDIYDARIDGGFPEPLPPAPQCEGEACQNAPEAPNDPTPASESFQGAGNVKETAATQPPARKPCAKGKVRRKGRCVARKHKKAAKRAHHKRRAAR